MESTRDINLFLQSTRYLNYDHFKIKKAAQEIAKAHPLVKQKVLSLFYWVKENIKFEFGYWGIKASAVLQRKRGMCTNKANLLIALLRATNIPAGYGILRVETKRFYQELMCPIFRKLVSPDTIHVYVGVFLDGAWIRCDPSVDSGLAQVLKSTNPFVRMTGFNITEKEMRSIGGILKRKEFFTNIDKDLDKPARNAKGKKLEISNFYLKFLREKGGLVKNCSDYKIEKIFLNWLSKKNKSHYMFLQKF